MSFCRISCPLNVLSMVEKQDIQENAMSGGTPIGEWFREQFDPIRQSIHSNHKRKIEE